jgi:putative PEP-CTERM system TPR-repeat lipoprotein
MRLESISRSAVCRILILSISVLIAACIGKDPQGVISSAKDHLATKDYKSAVIQLKNALQQAPDNGEARLLLGRALHELRDFASAEKELRLALELGQSQDAVLPLLARALVEQNEFERLTKEFGDRQLADAQARAAYASLIGEAHLRQGRRKEAEAAFASALSAQPEYADARLGLAELAIIDGNPDAAVGIVDALIAASPKMARAYMLRARLLSRDGKRAEARQALEQAVQADAAFMPARAALVQSLIDESAFDQAMAQIDAARKAEHGDLSLTYLEALLEFRRGNLDKARNGAAQVLKYAPGHVPTLVLAGATELRANQFATGESHLRRALAAAPGHIDARRMLAAAYLQKGQPARAMEMLQPILTSEAAKDPKVVMLAGETFLALGDFKRAVEQFSLAAAVPAVKITAQTRLGQIALARGDAADGVKQLEATAAQDSETVEAELALLAAHMRRNEFDKAMQVARAIERKQPDNPRSHYLLGSVNLARKDRIAARKNFDKALEVNPTFLPAVTALASLDVDDNKPDEARRRFEAAIVKEPGNEQAYLGLADLQGRTGSKPEVVAATLQRAVAANPQAVNPRLALVEFYLRERNPKSALLAAQGAAAALPNEPRVQSALASAQEAAGEANQAIETLNRLAALEPETSHAMRQLAALHLRKQEFDLAVNALRRAQRVAPRDKGVAAELVGVFMRAGRFDDALKEAKALQRNEPKYAGGFVLEGDVHVAQRNWTEAERKFREALGIEPGGGRVATKLHATMHAGGKVQEADAYARKWLADNPKDAEMRQHLASRALSAGDKRTAFGLYQQVIAIEPNNAIALNNLAYVAGEIGDARAIGYAERAVMLAPTNAAALDTLGMLVVAKGDVRKGFEYLDRARALAPGNLVLRLNYAKALIKAGRKDEARQELEALQGAKDAFPGKREVEGLLKSL